MTDDNTQLIQTYSDANESDIVVLLGGIGGQQDDWIIDECRRRKLRKNVVLFLNTLGGDPDVAYRIARCLQIAYKTRSTGSKTQERGKLSIVIDGPCKSAGTLLCLAANKIIMSGNGQLGPLDIQLRNHEEVGEMSSGLTPLQAVKFLESHSTELYERHFSTLRFKYGFSTKIAAEVSTNITSGLMKMLYQQIDPIRLAEVDRFLRIANDYGKRLQNENLKENTLQKLITHYPSHGFVIDRNETRELFKNVENLTGDLRSIADIVRQIYKCNPDGFINFISNAPADKDSADSKEPPNEIKTAPKDKSTPN